MGWCMAAWEWREVKILGPPFHLEVNLPEGLLTPSRAGSATGCVFCDGEGPSSEPWMLELLISVLWKTVRIWQLPNLENSGKLNFAQTDSEQTTYSETTWFL